MVAQGTDVESRLNTLRESWEVCSPYAGLAFRFGFTLSGVQRGDCAPGCLSSGRDIYGLCSHCGHCVLLSLAAARAIVYRNSDHHTKQTAGRVGYEDYRSQQGYRGPDLVVGAAKEQS